MCVHMNAVTIEKHMYMYKLVIGIDTHSSSNISLVLWRGNVVENDRIICTEHTLVQTSAPIHLLWEKIKG